MVMPHASNHPSAAAAAAVQVGATLAKMKEDDELYEQAVKMERDAHLDCNDSQDGVDDSLPSLTETERAAAYANPYDYNEFDEEAGGHPHSASVYHMESERGEGSHCDDASPTHFNVDGDDSDVDDDSAAVVAFQVRA